MYIYILLLRRVTISFEQLVVYNICENGFIFREKKGEKLMIQKKRDRDIKERIQMVMTVLNQISSVFAYYTQN